MKKTSLKIAAADNMLLDALLFEPDDGQIKAAIMFNSGTAVPKEFYQNFVAHLANHGYAVVLYDYRGVGGSRPKFLRGFKANLRDWGEQDMVGVMDWLCQCYPAIPRFIIAHSMGGQLVGLMSNHSKADGAFMVATSIGYWRWMTGMYRYFCGFIWFAYVPVMYRLFGYVPIKIIRQGEDLPGGVALEWAAWCCRKNYISDFFGNTIINASFDKVRMPIRVIGFSDDRIANELTIPAMMAYYKNAKTGVIFLHPADIKRQKVGHFGFFSTRNKDPLWCYPLDWLDKRIQDLRNLQSKPNESIRDTL